MARELVHGRMTGRAVEQCLAQASAASQQTRAVLKTRDLIEYAQHGPLDLLMPVRLRRNAQ
eukprot:COSAG03_NODE_405_length_8175_cov_4.098935_6_plen_61_part_00